MIYNVIFVIIAFYRRLVSSMASLHVDLDREHQGAENLQREVRSYVSRVQQVETLLAQKVMLLYRICIQYQLSSNSFCVVSEITNVASCFCLFVFLGRRENCPAATVPSANERK